MPVSSILNKPLVSSSSKETRELGRRFSRILNPGDRVFLMGNLGSGKTTFSQGIAQGLGIKDFVRSSSFILVSEYAAPRAPLFHIDLYRLKDRELDTVGLEEYLFGKGISIVEWADKLKPDLRAGGYEIQFTWRGKDKREIEIRKR